MKVKVFAFATVGFVLLSGCNPGTGSDVLRIRWPDPVYEADLSASTSNVEIVNYFGRVNVLLESNAGMSKVFFSGVSEGVKSDTSWGVRSKPFAVAGDNEYAVLIEMEGDIPLGAFKPGARIEWFHESGAPLVVQDALGNDVAFSDSLKMPHVRSDRGKVVAFTRGRVPANARKACVSVVVDWPDLVKGQGVGIRRVAYFEGVKGQPLELGDVDAPALEVRGKSPSSDLLEPIRFRILDESGVDWSRSELRIDGVAVDIGTLTKDGEDYVFKPGDRWASNSIHRIEIRATDKRGNSGYDCGFMAFTEKRPRHPAGSIRDDGVIMIGGEPFFPLGWYRVRPCRGNGYDVRQGISEMRTNGLNVAHTYLRPGKEVALFSDLVSACEDNGVLIYAEPSTPKPYSSDFFPLVQRNLFNGLDYRAPIFWGVGDDTTRHLSVDEIKYVYRCCKSVDPAALTASADVAISGKLTDYVPYADILFVETYPIRSVIPEDDEMAKVALALDAAWESTAKVRALNRSVVSIPQAFMGWGQWKRLPTSDEIRCQTYLALACRARGLVYYASCGEVGPYTAPASGRELPPQKNVGPLDRQEFKESFLGLMHEIGRITTSLVRKDAAEQPVVTVLAGPENNVLGGKSIRCLLKEDGLLIVANSSHRNVKVSIRLPSGQVLTRDLPRNAGWSEWTGDR